MGSRTVETSSVPGQQRAVARADVPWRVMVALNLVNRPYKRRQTPDQVSELTSNRLSIYLRCLNELDASGVQAISSQGLAEQFHLNAAQIRKDLAYFGEFGVRGVG